jgi:hypothetical protein
VLCTTLGLKYRCTHFTSIPHTPHFLSSPRTPCFEQLPKAKTNNSPTWQKLHSSSKAPSCLSITSISINKAAIRPAGLRGKKCRRPTSMKRQQTTMPRLAFNHHHNSRRHSRSLRLDHRVDHHRADRLRMEGRRLGCRFWEGSFCFSILGYVVVVVDDAWIFGVTLR